VRREREEGRIKEGKGTRKETVRQKYNGKTKRNVG
jgi:hypothetical protein